MTVIHLFILLLTFIFMGGFLYLRFTKKVYLIDLTPEQLTNFYDYLFYLFICATSILILLTLLYFIKIFLYYRGKKGGNTNNGAQYLKKWEPFINKIQSIYYKVNIFYTTYGILFNLIPPMTKLNLISYADFLVNLRKEKIRTIVLIFLTLPRIIIIFVFLYEIYTGRLHYYFYSLLLLLIPLLFRGLVFILDDLGPRILPEFDAVLIKGNVDSAMVIETQKGKFKALEITLKPEFIDLDLDIVLNSFYYPALFLKGNVEETIKPIISKISIQTQYMYYLIHVLGLGYILFYL